MVEEAGELRQLLGLGEAVSHSTSQGSIHRNTKRNRFFSVTRTSTQYFCNMPHSSTAESRVQRLQEETMDTNGSHVQSWANSSSEEFLLSPAIKVIMISKVPLY